MVKGMYTSNCDVVSELEALTLVAGYAPPLAISGASPPHFGSELCSQLSIKYTVLIFCMAAVR